MHFSSVWKPCSLAGAAAWHQNQQRRQWQERQAWPCRASAAEAEPPAASPFQQQEVQQQASSSSSSSADTYEFTYRGSDGRLKATFEQAFKNRAGGSGASSTDGEASGRGGAQAPWTLSYQMSERYSLLWNDDLKARMLKRVAADELGIPDDELEGRLQKVQVLLPEIRQKLGSMRPQLVARLAAEVESLPGRLLQLKLIFPGANAGLLAMRQPELVLGVDLAQLEGVAAELRGMFPKLDIDRLVEENPAMLDVKGLMAAMEEAARIMPQLNMQEAMATDPQLIFSFQRGNALIPYDPPRPVEEGDDEYDDNDDDEYGAYYG